MKAEEEIKAAAAEREKGEKEAKDEKERGKLASALGFGRKKKGESEQPDPAPETDPTEPEGADEGAGDEESGDEGAPQAIPAAGLAGLAGASALSTRGSGEEWVPAGQRLASGDDDTERSDESPDLQPVPIGGPGESDELDEEGRGRRAGRA